MDLKTNVMNNNSSATCHLNNMESLKGPGLSKKTKTILVIVFIYALAFVLATYSR